MGFNLPIWLLGILCGVAGWQRRQRTLAHSQSRRRVRMLAGLVKIQPVARLPNLSGKNGMTTGQCFVYINLEKVESD